MHVIIYFYRKYKGELIREQMLLHVQCIITK